MNKKDWYKDENTELGKYQREIEKVSGSPTYCVLPWIHFATRPNGDMRLCCSSNASGAGSDHQIGLVKTRMENRQTLLKTLLCKHGTINT